MKTIFILLISMSFFISSSACGQSTAGEKKQHDASISGEKVEVYYFHFTRRCISCVNVQKSTERVITENFKEEINNGTLVYNEVNLSEPESRAIAESLNVGRQALLVVCGDKKFDLTMHGFMLASRDYERFKETLEEAIKEIKI